MDYSSCYPSLSNKTNFGGAILAEFPQDNFTFIRSQIIFIDAKVQSYKYPIDTVLQSTERNFTDIG